MAKLTSGERDSLQSNDFALPKQRKYPIEDRSHAVNALARSSQFGTPDLKEKVREKVRKKFPELKLG